MVPGGLVELGDGVVKSRGDEEGDTDPGAGGMSPYSCVCTGERVAGAVAVLLRSAHAPARPRYPSVGRSRRAAGPHHVLVLLVLGRQVSRQPPARRGRCLKGKAMFNWASSESRLQFALTWGRPAPA